MIHKLSDGREVKVINELKDGRRVDDLSDVTLPAGHPAYEVMLDIMERREREAAVNEKN